MFLLLAVACAPDKPDDTASVGTSDTAVETCTFYADGDGDGWGRGDTPTDAPCDAPPEGTAEQDGDCDDVSPNVHPAATERCNAIDDDCDGSTDEDASDARTGYPDLDEDGFGDEAAAVVACSLPDGLIERGLDCDDTDRDIRPGREDLDCDNVDDDCDGAVDGGFRVPEDQLDIQVAMNSAPDGATICVGPGTYVTGLDFRGRGQHVIAREGPYATIIDAAGAFSAVKFVSGEGPDSILEGFTVRNGASPQGAGVYISASSPTLRDVRIIENRCEDSSTTGRCEGTGVWIGGGSPVFEDVEISWNLQHAAISQGAGVYVSGGSPVFRGGSVAWNMQEGVDSTGFLQGAGVFVTGASPVFEGLVVDGNTQSYAGTSAASLDGAGIYAYATTGTWTDLVLNGNAQTCGGTACNASGAGLYTSAASALTLEGASITGNTILGTATTPRGYGAAVAAYADVALTLRGSTVDDNEIVILGASGLGQGGAFYGRTDVQFVLENVRVAGNLADAAYTEGGAMCLQEGADATLTNVILAGNTLDGTYSGRGAGIFARNNVVTLTQADVALNFCGSATCDGVGIHLWTDVALSFDGVNVFGNTGTSGRTRGGAIHAEYEGSTFVSVYSNLYDNSSTELSNVTTPSVADGNLFVDPLYASLAGPDPTVWNLTLQAGSPVRDAGNVGSVDVDGTRADVGAYGGPSGAW